MPRLIETFCEGKFRDDRNEDRCFVGSHFIAVIDGSSAAAPIGGRAGGIVAAETILSVLDALAPQASTDDFERNAHEALAHISQASGTPSPYAAAVVLSLARREIWRIGDCPFAIDGVWNIPEHNPHEQSFFRFRQMMAAGCARGTDAGYADLDAKIGEVTREWLHMTKGWVNADDNAFDFAALDERPAPKRFLEVFPVPKEARTVVLASDGAVVSRHGQRGPADVADMLDQIARLKSSDPHCLSEFPYWRRFLEGATFLDDTTLLSIAP